MRLETRVGMTETEIMDNNGRKKYKFQMKTEQEICLNRVGVKKVIFEDLLTGLRSFYCHKHHYRIYLDPRFVLYQQQKY